MTDILSIGVSGILAYRKSLAVTGENIVNANTEGYSRRDTELRALPGAGGLSPLSLPATSGGGASVDRVRRAEDPFISAVVQADSAVFHREQSYTTRLSRLEQAILAPSTDLGRYIQRFFDALQEVASDPTSKPARLIALNEAEQLTSQFRFQANTLETQAKTARDDAEAQLNETNALLERVLVVNRQIVRQGSSGQRPNGLLDERDRLLDKLAERINFVTVEQKSGAVEVYLGDSAGGPKLVDAQKTRSLGLRSAGDRVEVLIDPFSAAVPTNQLTGGSVAGVLTFHATAQATLAELNRLAVSFSDLVNGQHEKGVDLLGRPGGQVFSTQSLAAQPAASNRGIVSVDAKIVDPARLLDETHTATFSAKEGVWRVVSSRTQAAVTGAETVEIGGVRYRFVGQPQDGDTFTISPLKDAAKGMRALLKEPESLAAGLAQLAEAAFGNLGTGAVEVTAVADQPNTALPELDDVLTAALAPSAALRMRADGPLGVIPAGASGIDLFALGSHPRASFTLDGATVYDTLTIDLPDGSTTLSFALPAEQEPADLAALLNGDAAFRAAGLFAHGTDTGLELVAAGTSGALAAELAAGATVLTATSQEGQGGGEIHILTREGRHLAGTRPLTAAEIESHLTAENGFSASAVYNTDHLEATGEDAYRGFAIDRARDLATVRDAGPEGAAGAIRDIDFEAHPGAEAQHVDPGTGTAFPGSLYRLTVDDLPTVTIPGDDAVGKSGAEIARLMLSRLNALGAGASVLGGTLSSPPADGTTVAVEFDGDVYELTYRAPSDGSIGVFEVTGGDAGAVTAELVNRSADGASDTFQVVITAERRVSGHQIRVLAESEFAGNAAAATALGLDSGARSILRGTVPDPLPGPTTLTVNFDGVDHDLAITHGVAGASGSISWKFEGDELLVEHADPAKELRIVTSDAGTKAAAAALGFEVRRLSVESTETGLRVTSDDPAADVAVDAVATSLIAERVRLPATVAEDLVVLVTAPDGSVRRLVANYPGPLERTAEPPQDLRIRFTSETAFEVFDAATGSSVANRDYVEGQTYSILGTGFAVRGGPKAGDEFTITADPTRIGDNRNMLALLKLQSVDAYGPRSGSFQDIYAAEAARIGATVQTARLTMDAAKVTFDESRTTKEALTGVDLDQEAARLIQFQQAYQASAQVISTAQEMFRSLLEVM